MKTLRQLEADQKKLLSQVESVKKQINILSRESNLKDIVSAIGKLAKEWDSSVADIALDIAILSIPQTHQKILKDMKKEIAKQDSAPVVAKKKVASKKKSTSKKKPVVSRKDQLLKNKTFLAEVKNKDVGQTSIAKKYKVSTSMIYRIRKELKVL